MGKTINVLFVVAEIFCVGFALVALARLGFIDVF